jgi:hypothetical protein
MAYLACAQDTVQSARGYAHPILQFLASHSGEGATPAGDPQAHALRQSAISAALRSSEREAQSGLWLAMLPVLFVGLISPLNMLSPGSLLCLGRAPAAPWLPSSFQRPPPHLA